MILIFNRTDLWLVFVLFSVLMMGLRLDCEIYRMSLLLDVCEAAPFISEKNDLDL